MAVYYAVFDRQEQGANHPAGDEHGVYKLLGPVETARVVKFESSVATVDAAQKGIQHFFQGQLTGTPVIVAEAAFKES